MSKWRRAFYLIDYHLGVVVDARKQSNRDIQKQADTNLRVLRLMKTGEVAYIEPLAKLMSQEVIKKCRKLLKLT